MDVIDTIPSDDTTLEETLKAKEVEITSTPVETREPEIHHKETIISLHALSSISSPHYYLENLGLH